MELSDKEIEETFSDCIFFFDEIHRFNPYSSGDGEDKTEKKEIYDYLFRITQLLILFLQELQ